MGLQGEFGNAAKTGLKMSLRHQDLRTPQQGNGLARAKEPDAIR